jgi:hypothetical protein
MFVAGVIAIASLGVSMIALMGAAVLLAYIDKRCDVNRQH